MPILIENESQRTMVSPANFSTEQELEQVLKNSQDLLKDENTSPEDGSSAVAFVASQLVLPEAGRLDLLFIRRDGLPIAVEVKLARNAQSRREVVAQAIDYLSSLTALTVDELDQLVEGRLEDALRQLVMDDDTQFDLAWRSVGTNLRAGKARLVVALDDAPPPLERIFRFLTRFSGLDAQLLTVQQYPSTAGKIYVSRTRVDTKSEPGSSPPDPPQAAREELLAAVEAYNLSAPTDLKAVGTSPRYRNIRIAPWEGRTHYGFIWRGKSIRVKLSWKEGDPPSLLEVVKKYAGRTLGDGVVLEIEEDGGNLARLYAKFPTETPPQTIANAMGDLLSMTKSEVIESLKSASGR
jgi:hypothetical protein